MIERTDRPSDSAAAAAQFGLPLLAFLAAVGFALSGSGSQTVWYVVRATGIVSYVLITLTVIAGLLVSNRTLKPGRPRVDIYEVHRFLSLVAISAAGFHALTLLLDSFIGFSPAQILVPFTSNYRPVAVALGIMALYGSITVYASFYLKRWIGQKAWRAIHYASFTVFALASYHGILAGADTGQAWMLAVYLGAIASVLSLLVYRIMKATEPEARAASARQAPKAPRPSFDLETATQSEFAWRRPGRG